MRFLRSSSLALFSLAVLLGSGCETVGVEDFYFRSASLAPTRILFSGHLTEDPDMTLGMYTLYVPATASTRYAYRRDGKDYYGPSIMRDAYNHFHIIYGFDELTIYDTVASKFNRVPGVGLRQMAPAVNPEASLHFAYMDGSDAGGYNILVQVGYNGTPTALTSDASASLSYWTPSFSWDGEWILFAKVAGTTGADAQLWRVHPNGTGAEQLPITTTELPTDAVFSPDGTEIFVPGDFTSYLVADGSVGTFDHVREQAGLLTDLSAMGYEFVGSAITGPTHTGEETTSFRHTFPISCMWDPLQGGNRIFFDALVASNQGSPPHEILGIVVFTWVPGTQTLARHTPPMLIGSDRTDGYRLSPAHPTTVPVVSGPPPIIP